MILSYRLVMLYLMTESHLDSEDLTSPQFEPLIDDPNDHASSEVGDWRPAG